MGLVIASGVIAVGGVEKLAAKISSRADLIPMDRCGIFGGFAFATEDEHPLPEAGQNYAAWRTAGVGRRSRSHDRYFWTEARIGRENITKL